MENWLQEKLQIASDESYKDPANIQNKHQKHQGFEAELAANAERLQALLGTGQGKFEVLHWLGKYLIMGGFLKMSLKIESALISDGNHFNALRSN